jgi:excinuclease UvrABC nuclease subunit
MPGETTDNIVRQIRTEFPQRPGVYLFSDNSGDVIYIGKSVNIKRRALSYFQKSSHNRETKIKAMVSGICKAEYYETVNDFLALLLEDKLIKKYYPYYNIRQKKYKRYKYLMLTNGLYPTVRVLNTTKKIRNKTIFGPFKGRYDVNNLIDIIQKYFNLRLCYESNPVTKCLYHDLDYCKAPCIMKIMPLEYTRIVNKVICFLNGSSESIICLLEKKLENCIENAEFEAAEEIRNLIEFCMDFGEKQRFFNRFKYGKLMLHETNNPVPFCVFDKGRLQLNSTFLSSEITTSNNGLLLFDNEIFNDSRILLDRANIIYNQLTHNRNNYSYVFEN